VTAVLVVLTSGAVATLVWAESQQRTVGRLFKMVASAGFIAIAVSVGAAESGYGRAVLAALALSWMGDLLLSYRSPRAFRGGLVAFLLAHVAYIAAFAIRGLSPTWLTVAAAGVLVVAVFVWAWLRPNLDRTMVGPVAAYVVVISVMVAFAFGTVGYDTDPRIALGAVAFFVSDLFVARNQFVTPGFGNRAAGLPIYYLGQVLLALSSGT